MEPILQLNLANNSNNVRLDGGGTVDSSLSSPDNASSSPFDLKSGQEEDQKPDCPPSTSSSSSSSTAPVTMKPASDVKKEEEPKEGKEEPKIGSVAKRPLVRGGKGIKKDGPPSEAKPKPRARKKVPLAMYHSQISDNKFGIKLCIKKSLDVKVPAAKSSRQRPARKRSKKKRGFGESPDEDDDSDYEKRRRKEPAAVKTKLNNNNNSIVSFEGDKERGGGTKSDDEDGEQSCWGHTMPENVLHKIFQDVVGISGCLPSLVKLSRVCVLWRRVAKNASLWHTLDLASWTKEKYRTELHLKWLIENRLGGCSDLNVSNWKVMNIQCVLDKMAEHCPDLMGLILSGWKGLMSDHLTFIATEFKQLQRIDLSSINVEVNANKTAVGLASLCNAVQIMGDRLRHLHLANNRLAGLPQLIGALAQYSPNLALLDLSNITTMAQSHAVLPLEKLQHGCSKLKVLRITNAQLTLGPSSLVEQMEAPGFPELEELSLASFSRAVCDEFLQRILKSSTKLKLLDVRGCPRITHDSLIRLPAWDLRHLFLSGCSITRDMGSGLELIASKWAHSLIEFDLAWANAQVPLDNALKALAEKKSESPLNHLDLCGSSVSLEAVKEVLENCPNLNSINLSSCRSLPRGQKRLLEGPTDLKDLRESLGVTLKMP